MQQRLRLPLGDRKTSFVIGWRYLARSKPPQVHVRIDQARHHPETAQINQPAATVLRSGIQGLARFDPSARNLNCDIRLRWRAAAIP